MISRNRHALHFLQHFFLFLLRTLRSLFFFLFPSSTTFSSSSLLIFLFLLFLPFLLFFLLFFLSLFLLLFLLLLPPLPLLLFLRQGFDTYLRRRLALKGESMSAFPVSPIRPSQRDAAPSRRNEEYRRLAR